MDPSGTPQETVRPEEVILAISTFCLRLLKWLLNHSRANPRTP